MFGVSSVTKLSPDEDEAVNHAQTQSHTWRLHHDTKRVFACGKELPCIGDVYAATVEEAKACTNCLNLLKNQQFQTAIQKKKLTDDKHIFTPHQYQAAEIGKQFAAIKGLSTLIEEHSNGTIASLLQRTIKAFTSGQFDNKPMWTGLLEVLVVKADREANGKGIHNFKYPPGFDNWAHKLCCINPEVYRSFREHFGGRTERSFREIRAKRPAFQEGFHSAQLLQWAHQYNEDYGYPLGGPLSMAVDDTKLHEALLPYFNNDTKTWYLVGSTCGVKEVIDLDSVQGIIDQEKDYKSSKLRLWTLNIPLPTVPPLILAAKAIPSKITASQLADFEKQILDVLLPDGFKIVALGSDGTSVERDSCCASVCSGHAEMFNHRIPSPEPACPPIEITMLQIQGSLLSVIQDSQHLRKTCRNNMMSSTRTLVLGAYTIFYEDIRQMASDFSTSPLYFRDVDRLDHQDDRAAAQLFSAQTLEYAINKFEDNLGMIVYLFAFGEMVDAYQNWSIPHLEHVKMLYRALYFKKLWKQFLKESGYSESQYFISREADDIIDIFVNGFMVLLYVHHDQLEGKYPLCPWVVGSESNEHAFGFIRIMVPDFTLLDFLRLPVEADFQKTASGYNHFYFDADGINLLILLLFPSDEEITAAIKSAHEEACALWALLGYYASLVSETTTAPAPGDQEQTEEAIQDENETVGEDDILATPGDNEQDEEDTGSPSGKPEVEEALEMAKEFYGQKDVSQPHTSEVALNKCSMALAATNLADLQNLESLSEDNLELMEEIRNAVQGCLSAIASQSDEGTCAVQALLQSVSSTPASENPSLTTQLESANVTPTTTTPFAPDLISFDLCTLARLRFTKQTKEARLAVRIPKSGTQDKADLTQAHTTNKEAVSQRKLLAQKIQSVVKRDMELGLGTGFVRRARYEKSAAGGTQTQDQSASGNAANARVVAKATATMIANKRRLAFASITGGVDLATAKVDALTKLTGDSYGLVLVNGELMVGKVLTLYKRGGGKVAKHGWVSEASSIGAVSYVPVQVWQQIPRQHHFHAIWYKNTVHLALPRFNHLPSSRFLLYIPPQAVHIHNTGILELGQAFCNTVFMKYHPQTAAMTACVDKLISQLRKQNEAVDTGS